MILPSFWGDYSFFFVFLSSSIRLHFFLRFFEFFNKATAYTLEQIFTQNTSEDVVPGKEVPFVGFDNYI